MKLKKKYSPLKLLSQSQPNFAEMILKAHHYAYTVQIWALSGLKSSSFGHLKTFQFLVMVAILDTRRC
jgi:hypothetical protein